MNRTLARMPVDGPSSSNENAESSGLGPASAHPGFAAHFTAVIYDPDDSANDETAPFGGDEGADVYAEWADRTDELEGLTLRRMLELDDDPSGSKTGPSDLDETTIAAGFVHLRATGWIDREGAAWLRAALERSDRADPGAEFATMLQDLATYSNKPPKVGKAPATRGWLRIRMGAGDGPLTRWCRATEKAMAVDPAWNSWWSSTRFTSLDFYPGLFDPEARVTLEEEGQLLVVLASAPQLTRVALNHVSVTVTSDSPPLPSLMTLPNVRDMLDSLLLSALQTAAGQTRLQAPPAHLPPQDS